MLKFFVKRWGFKNTRMARRVASRKRQPAQLGAEVLEDRTFLAANLFVAMTGNDTLGTGTVTSPYATLGRALNNVAAGDTITLRGGNYTGGVRVDVPNVTIQSQPGEWAILTAPTTNENIDSVIRFNPEASGGKLLRLEIVGGYYYAVMFNSTWDWNPNVPFSQRPAAGRGLIEDCKLHDSGRDVIKITPGADDITIRRSEIYNSGRRDPSNAEGIDNVNGDRLVVQDSYFHDIATNGIYAKGGAIGAVIERNLITNTGGGGIMVGFYTDEEWFDTTANPNYYENIDAIVRNNIIVNTNYAGIGLFASLRAQIYNNTLINVAQTGMAAVIFTPGEIYFGTNPRPRYVPNVDPVLVNNIVTQAANSSQPMVRIRSVDGAAGLAGTLTMSNNRYSAAGRQASFEEDRTNFTGSLAQWQVHINGDAGSSEGNPQLDANYHLMAGSPLIDAGANLSAVTNDYDGNARSGRLDIGADEANAGPVLSVPPPPGTVGTGTGIVVAVGSNLQFGSASYTVGEAAGNAVLTVTRTGSTTEPVSVNYVTSNGTATAGTDYQAATGTLSFAAGETSKSISFPVLDDALVESSETVLVTLSNPTGTATLGSPNATVLTILDNDQRNDQPRVGFQVSRSQASEVRTSAALVVTLSAASLSIITVPFAATGGTAAGSGEDYTLANGTLTFLPGQRTKTIVLSLVNDTRDEPNETIQVTLAAPANAVLGTNKLHTYTILDDDPRPKVAFTVSNSTSSEATPVANVAVSLTAASGKTVTVNYAVTGGTATGNGVDFRLANGSVTFQPGETTKNIPIAVVDDIVKESNETIQVRLSAPTNAALDLKTVHTVTILDNDLPGTTAPGHLVYRVSNGNIYRIEVRPGATPENLSQKLNALSPGSADDHVNLSPDGQWLVVTTDRFGIGSWTGLAVVNWTVTEGAAVRVNGEFVHPEGASAVASGGNLIVYSSGDGPHTRDLWAITRQGTVWGTPVLLTASSPYAFNAQPAISADGSSVVFDGGNQPYGAPGTAICEVRTDGSAFRNVVTQAARPAALPDPNPDREEALHHADYAPDGSIVFEADWSGEQLWRVTPGSAVPVRVGPVVANDNSPSVLPDGRVASLWLGSPDNVTGFHQIKVTAPDGGSFFLLLTDQDVLDIGLGAGA